MSYLARNANIHGLVPLNELRLASEIGVDRSSIGRMVDDLEQAGRLSRFANKGRRGIILRLH